MKNKKGWLRLVESFTTILLISLVLLIILNRSNFNEEEKTSQILDIEYSILREIQLNNSLRAEILKVNVFTVKEINWSNFESLGLGNVKSKIQSRTPGQLNCTANICEIGRSCDIDYIINKSVYSRSAIITANLTYHNPRELKLFCWDI